MPLVDFLYNMALEKDIKKLSLAVTERLYALHQKKFNGNNVHLAKASGCGESTIRNIFARLNNKKGQDITISMAFRLCHGLDVNLSDIVKDLGVKSEVSKKSK